MQLDKYKGYESSRLGLHWVPAPYHAHADLTWALDKCEAMGIRWMVIEDDGGGSSLQMNPYYDRCIIDMLTQRNIIPIVRFYAPANARFDMRMQSTLVELVKHGVKYVFWQNEPEVGSVEWKNRPKNWVEICMRNYIEGAYRIIDEGAYPGMWATTTWQYPDEDGNIINPFMEYMLDKEREDIFINGPGWLPIHNYSKNHPIDYPYDDVNKLGKPMTHEEYEYWVNQVDPVYSKTQHLWVFDDYQTSEHHINFNRKPPSPDYVFAKDDVCFNMYRGMIEYVLKPADLYGLIPMISTECGPCVGDRDDGRYAKVTPQQQIIMVEQQQEIATLEPSYFGMCYWLAGVQRLNTVTADSFEDQSWWTDRHNDPFNLQGEMPIVQYLIEKKETKVMHKLGAHFQIGNQATLDQLPMDMPVVKSMDLNPDFGAMLKQHFPNALRIARVFVDNQDRYKTDPQGLIDEIINKFIPVAEFYDAIETGNEIINNSSSKEDAKLFDKYQVNFANTVWSKWPNIKVVGFNIATGNLGVDNELSLHDFPYSMQLPINKFLIGYHSYSWERMSTTPDYYCLRYRKLAQGFEDHKFVITECGVTNAVISGRPDVGWRTHGKRDQFIEDLVWFNNELIKDKYVVGATVFNCGPSFGWDTFESTMELRDAINNIANVPQPSYATPIRVLVDDDVVTLELEEYLKGVLPSEMPSTWPTAALEAQAVAARTYAMYRLKHPRSTEYDIYGDTRDQVYNPSKRTTTTDKIVDFTKGETYSSGNGQYVARCGLTLCPICQGTNGTNGNTFPGRLCQYGAKYLAEQGKTADEILTFYYDYEEETPMENPNKAEQYGVTVGYATGLKQGEMYFKLQEVRMLTSEENGAWPGNHNIFVDVIGANGDRLYGAQVSVHDSYNNVVSAIIEKKPPELWGTDIPLWDKNVEPINKRSVYVSQPVLKCDIVNGIHTVFPDEGGNNNNLYHRSWSIVYKLVMYQDTQPPIEEKPLIDEMRNIMWNNLAIPFNPDAAFPKKARELNFGVPVTTEVEYKGEVLQGFSGGWLHCVKGDWANIKQEKW
jgi:hypothetical protein